MNKMERKFGRYAIPNLMYYIVILYAVGVLVQMMAPAFYIQYLMLDAEGDPSRTDLASCYIYDLAAVWQSFLQPDSDLPLLQSGNDSGAGLGNLPVLMCTFLWV